ncbi:efflux RND transporter periplasmic adaptor subunit [Agarivorans sp. QJM3NY_25]|uniref:efflux RND transporter periplasmic adaptor subunit n=1 Tax=Agarivorans sp. QJM3NY_25 TaxID=3421430 RepID=UPI003D7F0387
MSHFSWKQRLVIIPPLILGGLFLAFASSMKAEPPAASQAPPKKVVRVLKVLPRKIQPMVQGYGYTEPEQQWQAQAELEGTVIWVHQDFDDGGVIQQGAVILKLDPSTYQLEVAKLNAEIAVAQLKDRTISESLNIAVQEYELQKSEYQRILKLSSTGHISKTEKDNASHQLLSSQQQLQTLKNSLVINQAEQQVLQIQLAQAERDLINTSIVAPFALRITETLVDKAEYVSKGQALLRADGISAVEVKAQFPLGKMRPLHQASVLAPMEDTAHNNLSALVSLKVGEQLVHWQAQVSRSGGQIDAQTQSQSIVVHIDNPYQQAKPGEKPPLIRDTFVQVTLKAPLLNEQLLVPANAVHNDQVYLVDQEGKLVIQPVKVAFIQQQIAVIQSGLQSNDKVVLSQLSPAVTGMQLKPQADPKIQAWLDKTTGFKASKPQSMEGQ